jgi:uncharacterized protein (DUF2252 family)
MKHALPLDPFVLAERQLARDRERTKAMPVLLTRKIARMTASPHAFLRGASPLFYELLREQPELAEGPPGFGWLIGDLHLENFGAFRGHAPQARSKSDDDPVVFDLNDFDDAFEGPWFVDVLRLLTSLVLAGRELGASGPDALGLARVMVDGYVTAAFDEPRRLELPRPVASLVAKVEGRTRKLLLDARTVLHGETRRFVRAERYLDIAPALDHDARVAFRQAIERLGKDERSTSDHTEVLDVAFRVAGTGSLGGLRLAVLARGKGGPDGAWVYDMKEESEPSAALLFGPQNKSMAPAERVATGLHRCLATPPRQVTTTELGGLSMLVRRLAPQEDKLDLGRLAPEDLPPLARYLGGLVGAAHRRGGAGGATRWSGAEQREVVERALVLAGAHEAAYLAFCALTGS